MTHARKHLGLAVLLALLIGHFGMAVHVTTHAIGEVSKCDLCLSYNDASEALTALPEPGVAATKESSTVAAARDPVEKRNWAPFLQRDPPGSI